MKSLGLKIGFFAYFFSLIFSTNAQTERQKYWVFFAQKDTVNYDYRQHLSSKTIQNRIAQNLSLVQFTDIPLTPKYIQMVAQETQLAYQSKWLNAVSVLATPTEIEQIQKFHFVNSISQLNHSLKVSKFAPNFEPNQKNKFGNAIAEMSPQSFIKAGLNGKGITIGVIDAGFYGAKWNNYLKHLFTQNKILGIKDLVNPKHTKYFTQQQSPSDDHGVTVLQMIAGKVPDKKQDGFATESQFYLARTDDGNREFRGEEDYWISAMEWMDSLGVRLINTSLGYSLDFDDPNENYKPEEMNGKTSKITQMAQLASKEKGILVIVSAGNEGLGSWKVLSAPADAQGVLSVGATTSRQMKASYSSKGTEILPYLKPEVACFSMSGTSFSAPIITGFAACLMQRDSTASASEIKHLIEQSSHLYPFGNNYIGYGIPNAQKALQITENQNSINSDSIQVIEKFEVIPNPDISATNVILFHKKDTFRVVKQERKNIGKKPIWIIRPKDVRRTTLVYGDKVTEILWQD